MMLAEQPRAHTLLADAPGTQTRGSDIEAIFEQARQRQKRRRRACAVVVATALLAAAPAIGMTIGGGGGTGPVHDDDNGSSVATVQSRPAQLGRPAVQLAWIDSDGQLNVGDPATWALQVVPTTGANPNAPLVYAAGQLYWAEANQAAPIRAYNLATSKIRYLATGEAVFTSANGQSLYIARSARTLLELPAIGVGKPAVFNVPPGWHMSGIGASSVPTAAGNGVIVSFSHAREVVPRAVRFGLWDPLTGRVRVLGVGITIFGVYSPPGASYSLIAWEPATRGTPLDWSFRITDTSTWATVAVRSHLHRVTAADGVPAFSPSGTQMAVFVQTTRWGSRDWMSGLAIVNTRTGAVRLVPGAALPPIEGAHWLGGTYWALWLPGGRGILAGAVAECAPGSAVAVDTRTLRARPFSFFDSTDGFSATVVPGRA